MKQFLYTLLSITILLLFANPDLRAQDSTGLYNKIAYFPDRLFKKVQTRSNRINNQLTNQSEKYLQRMAREERKLQRKLSRTDTLAAKRIFGDAQTKYTAFGLRIKNVSGKTNGLGKKYLPHLDSLQTAFSLLSQANLFEKRPGTDLLLKDALNNISTLEDKFSQAENIQEYMTQRRQFLEDQLEAYGLTKDLGNLKQQVYYYQSQVEEYRNAFENPSQLETKAMAVLQKTSLFKKFFREHSQLAGLFRLPDVSTATANPIAGFASFQTRSEMEQQLLQRFGAIPNLGQLADGQILNATDPIARIKDQLGKLSQGSKNNNKEMPDFRPNNQKTKSFGSRLEFGANLQTVKSNNFFPSTSDIAVSVGYKLNDKSIIGIGSSYKMGWGKNIRNIDITHQGVGVRSFIDYRIKGSFWLSGGAEMNYRSKFNNFEILDDYAPWQKSALLGLSKKYQVSKKIRGNMQLLYDFLYREQVPRTPSLLFRIGYTL